jgi:hypothetical protein
MSFVTKKEYKKSLESNSVMTEHTTQSKDNPVPGIVETKQADKSSVSEDTGQKIPPPHLIIWTPSFIVVFFLTLVTGLSVESLLTQGWLNRAYNVQKILLGHIIIILGSLIVLVIKGRSTWIRVGGIFGCIWAVFTGASYIAILLGIASRSVIELEFQAATACALLGTYICFSTHNIPFRRWDSLFFWLAPIAGGGAVAILYAHSLANSHHARELIDATTTVLLWLSVAIWWLRPSCWRSQPCITFLFGLTTLLMIAVPSIPNDSMGTPLFVSQLLLLCMLLGILRVVQGEIR